MCWVWVQMICEEGEENVRKEAWKFKTVKITTKINNSMYDIMTCMVLCEEITARKAFKAKKGFLKGNGRE